MPLYVLNVPYYLLKRLRLSVVWFVAAVPFEPSMVVLVLGTAAALRWFDYVFDNAPNTAGGIRRARALAATGFLVAASCRAAVAGEANPGPDFPTALVNLTNGASVSGAYVGYSGGTIYVGEGQAIRVIPARQIVDFSVRDTPDRTAVPTSLFIRESTGAAARLVLVQGVLPYARPSQRGVPRPDQPNPCIRSV